MKLIRLFNAKVLDEIVRGIKDKIFDEVSTLPESELSLENRKRLTTDLARRYLIFPIKLNEPRRSPVTIKAPTLFIDGSPAPQSDVVIVTFTFEGDAFLLECLPSRYPSEFPLGAFNRTSVSIEVPVGANLEARVDASIKLLKECVGCVNDDAERHKPAVVDAIDASIKSRVARQYRRLDDEHGNNTPHELEYFETPPV